MTKEEIKKAAKVMLAYAQGESIQRQDPNGNWVDCVSPTFDWGSYDYRVKPKMPKADEIEHEVGEVFEVNGVKLQVVEPLIYIVAMVVISLTMSKSCANFENAWVVKGKTEKT